jgi:hypothetical protein
VNEKQKALLKLPPKRVESILLELAAVRRRANEGEKIAVPLVTLHLSSGRDLAGWLIDVGDDRHVPALVMQSPGSDSRSPRLDVTYLDRERVEAITVHDAADIAHVLSFGEIDGVPGAPAPTRLELARRVEELARSLAEAVGAPMTLEVAWEGISEQRDTMYSLNEVVEDTVGAIKKIAEDGFGRDELVKRVGRVRIENGDGPRVVREQDLLRIVAAFGTGRKGRLDRVSLIVAIGAEI